MSIAAACKIRLPKNLPKNILHFPVIFPANIVKCILTEHQMYDGIIAETLYMNLFLEFL